MNEMNKHPVPNAGRNNFWYEPNGDHPTLVFVHGIFSDSRSCWLSSSETNGRYWPELVLEDSRLAGMPIFMGGYYTRVGSGRAEIRNCAEELFQGLSVPDASGNAPPMTKSDLIFICHSTGGIVVRYLLISKRELFKEKKIGLVLISSPSGGSKWASRFRLLARLYGNRLFQQLEWDNWSLRNLDHEFKNLVNDRRIPNLQGVEACEEHFIISHPLLPNFSFVVSEESACKYFGAPHLLSGTDHSTAVKPTSFDHPAHRLLVEFTQQFARTGSPRDGPQPQLDLPISDYPNPLFYGNRKATLVGRAQPQQRIEAWLADPKSFSWWVMIGPAGSGKSRLALECALSIRNGHAGFLRVNDLDFDWETWRPVDDTFVVIDYAASAVHDINSILSILEKRANSFNSRVRILLIERSIPDSEQDSWLRKVLGEGTTQQKLKRCLFEAEPIALGELSDDDLWEVFSEEVLSKNRDLPPKHEYLPGLIERDPKRRPLFALLGADAYLNGRDSKTWNAHELLDLQLRYQRSVWEPLEFDERYQNVLIFATIIQYLELKDLFQAGLNKYFPKASKFRVGLYKSVVPDTHAFFREQGRIGLGALEPDLLGEFFVLQSLLPSSYGNKVAEFAKALWTNDGQIFAVNFVRKAVEDFPDHPTIQALLEPRREYFNLAWGMAFTSYVNSFADRHQIDKALELYYSVSEFYAEKFSDPGLSPMLRLFRIELAQTLCLHCLDDDKISEAASLYAEVCEGVDPHLDKVLFADYRFNCVKALVRWYSTHEKFSEAYSIFERHLDWILKNKHAKHIKRKENAQHLYDAFEFILVPNSDWKPDSTALSRKVLQVAILFEDARLANSAHAIAVLWMGQIRTRSEIVAALNVYKEITEFELSSNYEAVTNLILNIGHLDVLCESVLSLWGTNPEDKKCLSSTMGDLGRFSEAVRHELAKKLDANIEHNGHLLNIAGLVLFHRRVQATSFQEHGDQTGPRQLEVMLDFCDKSKSVLDEIAVNYMGPELGPKERLKDAFLFLVLSDINAKPPNLPKAIERLRFIFQVEPTVGLPTSRNAISIAILMHLMDLLRAGDQLELSKQMAEEYVEFLDRTGKLLGVSQEKGRSVAESKSIIKRLFDVPSAS